MTWIERLVVVALATATRPLFWIATYVMLTLTLASTPFRIPIPIPPNSGGGRLSTSAALPLLCGSVSGKEVEGSSR